MPRTPEEQEAWERRALGCTADELKAANSILYPRDRLMLAMSILSDAQEIIHRNPIGATQYMNRAKLMIAEQMDADRHAALLRAGNPADGA